MQCCLLDPVRHELEQVASSVLSSGVKWSQQPSAEQGTLYCTGGTLVIACWCQREETPERPLTKEDKERLQFLYDEWAHPFFISIEEFGSLMEVRLLQLAPRGVGRAQCCCACTACTSQDSLAYKGANHSVQRLPVPKPAAEQQARA